MELNESQRLIETLQLHTGAMAEWESGLVWQLARQVLTEQRPLKATQASALLRIAETYLDPTIVAEGLGQQRLFK